MVSNSGVPPTLGTGTRFPLPFAWPARHSNTVGLGSGFCQQDRRAEDFVSRNLLPARGFGPPGGRLRLIPHHAREHMVGVRKAQAQTDQE